MKHKLLRASPYLLGVVAVLVLLRGVIVAQPDHSAVHVEPTPVATTNVPVAPLKTRIPAHLIVVSKTPITKAQRDRLV
ncbi:MAG: hypothetical protein JWN31_712, partial [Frankiales bacterium]|nr:hypothetical protein [Frankiales bacterium]